MYFQFNVLTATAMPPPKKKKDWNFGVLCLLMRLDKKYNITELINIVKW